MSRGHVLSTSQRGYGHRHQQLRRKVGRLVDEGRAYCTRCGGWIAPGSPWDLDHDDRDRSKYRGCSHPKRPTWTATTTTVGCDRARP